MKMTLAIAGTVLATLLLFRGSSDAWTQMPGGYTWPRDHTCLTHEGLYQQYVASALEQWHVGSTIADCGSGTDIEVVQAAPQESHGGIESTAWTLAGCEQDLRCQPGEHLTHCTIWAAFNGQPEAYIEKAIWHEVGHCLGLDHTPWETFSIMNPGVSADSILQPDDRLAIATLYPPPPRRAFVSVGAD